MEPTASPDKPVYDPAEFMRALERSFFERLASEAGALAAALADSSLETSTRDALASLEPRVSHLVRNDLDRANVRFTLLAAAAYQVLAPLVGPAEAMRIVDEALNTPMRSWVQALARELFDRAVDPFAALVAASKEREQTSFGPSFTFVRPIDDDSGYVLDITRCLYHETLKACGLTELQPVLCRFDLSWIHAIDPARHHMQFTRPSTFATAKVCRMWFSRLEHLSDPNVRRLRVLNGPQDC